MCFAIASLLLGLCIPLLYLVSYCYFRFNAISVRAERKTAWWWARCVIDVSCRWIGTLQFPSRLCLLLPAQPDLIPVIQRFPSELEALKRTPASDLKPEPPASVGEIRPEWVNRKIGLGGNAAFVVLIMPWEPVIPSIDFAIRFGCCLQSDAVVLQVDKESLLMDFGAVLNRMTAALLAAVVSDSPGPDGGDDNGGDHAVPGRCVLFASQAGARLAVALSALPQVEALVLLDPIVASLAQPTPPRLVAENPSQDHQGTGAAESAEGEETISDETGKESVKGKGKKPVEEGGYMYPTSAERKKLPLKTQLCTLVDMQVHAPLLDWLECPPPPVPVCVMLDCFGCWSDAAQDWAARSALETQVAHYNSRDAIPALYIVQNWVHDLLFADQSSLYSGRMGDVPLNSFHSLAAPPGGRRFGDICRYRSRDTMNLSNISGDELNMSIGSSNGSPMKVSSPMLFGGGASTTSRRGILSYLPTVTSTSSLSDSNSSDM